MNFKVGDKVEVLDENLKGVITNLANGDACIETEDGFVLEFNLSDIIKVDNESSLNSRIFESSSINEVLNDKAAPKRRKVNTKKKERFQPTVEIDLHIDKLTTYYKNMSKHDILTYQLQAAKRQIEFAINKKIQKVVFIHGVGDGVLKIELEYLFKHYENIRFYDANYQKYGQGATEIYITQKAL